jgi:uncharacterized protein
MLNLLYLHGLNGSLSDEKRAVLNNYFNIFAPTIDYVNTDVNQVINLITKNNRIDLVMGNSMGGYVGYHTSRRLNVPSLLFNPAIFYKSAEINFSPDNDYKLFKNQMVIVLGKKDNIIDCNHTYQNLVLDDSIARINFSIYADLEHRIDLKTFQNEVENFFCLLKS